MNFVDYIVYSCTHRYDQKQTHPHNVLLLLRPRGPRYDQSGKLAEYNKPRAHQIRDYTVYNLRDDDELMMVAINRVNTSKTEEP